MAWQTVFVDGFDHYASADFLKKWSTNVSSWTIDSTTFRTSGKSLRSSNSTNSKVSVSVGQGRNLCIGFGVYLNLPPTAAALNSNGAPFISLSDAVGAENLGQVALALLSDGKLHAVRSNISNVGLPSAVELGASTTVLAQSQWYYVELRVFIDATAGQFEMRINGVTEVNLTNINTQFQAFNYASVLGVHVPAGLGNGLYVDDLYVRTSSENTAEAGGFFGDVKIKPYYPDADGTYAQMTPSTGTTHYTLVDETNPSTTDYVSSNTALQKDSYSFQPVSETGAVKAVQLNVLANKDDAGFRSIDLFTKSGATENFAASQPLSTSQLYKLKIWENDPNTGSSWSQTNLNAAEFGVRIAADV